MIPRGWPGRLQRHPELNPERPLTPSTTFDIIAAASRAGLMSREPREPSDSGSKARLEKSFEHIHGEVFEKEDLSIAESI